MQRRRVLLGSEQAGDRHVHGIEARRERLQLAGEYAARLLVAVELTSVGISRGARPSSSLIDLHRDQDLVILRNTACAIQQRLIRPLRRMTLRQRRVTRLLEKLR